MKARGPKLYKNIKTSGEIQEQDFKYMQQNPNGDSDFDPEHNQRVIAETIRKTKKRELELRKEYMNQVEERVDAGISLLKALERGKYAGMDANSSALKYFGRQELARLRGEEIKHELMNKFAMAKKLMNN